MEEHPSDISSRKRSALAFFQNNQLTQAKALYLEVCRNDPADAEAWHTLGVINGRLGLIDEAEAACRNAIAANPRYAPAHCDLGNALFATGKAKEAVECYQEALRLNGNSAEAYNNLGTALDSLGQLEEAEDSYKAALRLFPNAMTYCNLGNVLARQQKLEEAAAMYRECLIRDPNNWVARHRLVSCTGENVPARASDGYIRQMFDSFAGTFDKTLADIGYRVPEMVAETVAQVYGPPSGTLDILDAGCGTGLCGPGLRPYARQLVGVDLSAGMLAKAAERGLYDELIGEELTAFLNKATHVFDLIVTTDVLIYFGAVEGLFAAAAKSLRPGGMLIASAERADEREGQPGFRLNPHGRYSHTEGYVRRTLSNAGFSIESVRDVVLRMEAGNPVPGLIVVARLGS